MFQYHRLSETLQNIITENAQIKTILYSHTVQNKFAKAGINIRSAYSLLSTIINNLAKFDQARKAIEGETG